MVSMCHHVTLFQSILVPTVLYRIPSETTSAVEEEGEEDEERDEWFNEYLNLAELPKPPDRIPKEHVNTNNNPNPNPNPNPYPDPSPRPHRNPKP